MQAKSTIGLFFLFPTDLLVSVLSVLSVVTFY